MCGSSEVSPRRSPRRLLRRPVARARRRTSGAGLPFVVGGAYALLLCAAGAISPAAAQVADVCPPGEPECARTVQSAVDARARAALAVSGGAPLPGSASTLGRRTATSRHASLALRLTAVGSDAFAPAADGGAPAGSGTLIALSVDGAFALFDGFVAAPTVGGVLSVDALASAGWLGGGGAIDARGAVVWGAGLKVGILRESFTLPGVSISAMYRDIATLSAGDRDAAPRWEADADALSLRATVGKRIGALDAIAGGGWDRTGGSVAAAYTNRLSQTEVSGARDAHDSRWTGFAGAGWTFLVFQLGGELGWVEGGAGHAEEGFRIAGTDGAWFGTLSFRFTY